VALSLAGRQFSPPWWATLGTAAALGACVALGFWQLDRGRQKQALIEEFRRGSEASVVLTGTVDDLPRYQHVIVHGRLDGARHLLLDNMPSSRGTPGYRVLTPLRRTGSRTLLVDRGWVPLGASREELPAVGIEGAGSVQQLSGRLDELPRPGLRLGEAQVPGAQGWPRVLNFPTRADVEAVLGEPVESRILLLDPAADGGFERVWRPSLGFGPERHLGYAIQWFALGLAVLVAYLALNQRRRPASDAMEHRR
jgi:surfeit locus 1 family protein